MITIFNRRQLTLTQDTVRQAAIRDALAGAGIDYRLTTVNRGSPSPLAAGSRQRMGSLGEDPRYAYTYTFYVHKKDHERACHVLRGI